MAKQSIYSIGKQSNGTETTTINTYSFKKGDASFSFDIQERIWTERQSDGSHRVVDAVYVRQQFLSLMEQTATVQ